MSSSGETGVLGTTADTGAPPIPLPPVYEDGVRWVGGFPQDQAGYEVLVADLIGDATAEVLIGSPHGTPLEVTSRGVGVLQVVEGSAPSGVIDDFAVLTLEGGPVAGSFGASVAVGDYDADGVPEMAVGGAIDTRVTLGIFEADLVGVVPAPASARTTFEYPAPFEGPFGITTCGDVSSDGVDDLCAGGGQRTIDTTQAGTSSIFLGPIPTGRLHYEDADILIYGDLSTGRDTTGGGDLTGDGIPDLLVDAASGFGPGGKYGGVYLVDQLQLGLVPVFDFPAWSGEARSEYLGTSLAIGGDVDGDGRADAWLGAHTSDERRGRGHVATDAAGGPASTTHAVFESHDDLGWLGCSAAFGDYDGDGADDLAIGIPMDIYFSEGVPGRVAIFLGPVGPGIHTVDDAAAVWRGSDLQDGFGLRMDAGDVDGDGRDDLVVGAFVDSTNGPYAGAVTLMFGAGL